METIITNHLSKLEFGEPQEFKNMGAIPLFISNNHIPEFLTLKEALEKKLLIITEISHVGAVPELKVTNKARIPVLLIEGEELVGAKQNRVLNTTILLKKELETVIPVSCTEQGRWSYVSKEFADSGVVAFSKLRMCMAASVTESLKHSKRFESNQGAMWDEIHEMFAEAKIHSPTRAMRDVFESKTNDLEDYVGAFEYVPHQKGLLTFVNGEVGGLDFISLESAYKILHPKLVKSYAMDALLQKTEKSNKQYLHQARAFLKEATLSQEKKYRSIGHGWDYRFEGKAIVGTALIYRKKVIYISFYRTNQKS